MMRRLLLWSEWFLWTWYVPGLVFLLPWGARLIFDQTILRGQVVEGLGLSLSAIEVLIWGGGALLAFVAWGVGWRGSGVRWTRLVPVAVFIVWAVCGLVWAPAPLLVIQMLWRLATVGLLFLLILVAPSKNHFLMAFLFSAALQGFLALVQMSVQEVWPSTLLGMSGQVPYGPAAVLEYTGGRLLRAYGTFPHPNILGGFLAVAWLALLAVGWKNRPWLLAMIGLLIGLGLGLTFSRSAWLAALLGSLVWFFLVGRRQVAWRETLFRFGLLVAGLGIACLVFLPFVAGRVTGQARLEQRSLQERRTSLTQGLVLLQSAPLRGVGLANTLPVLLKEGDVLKEPPHAVGIILLLELGLVGCFLAAAACYPWLVAVSRSPAAWAFVAPLFVLALFDHYLWTTVPGLLLAAFFAAIAAKQGDS